MFGGNSQSEESNNNPPKYSNCGYDICKRKKIVAVKVNNLTVSCNHYGCIFINENRCLISLGKNNLFSLGDDELDKIISHPKQIPNLKEIKRVDCGYYHTACIDFDGNLFTFGDNYFGQLGIGKDNTEIISTHIPQKVTGIPSVDYISCGAEFTICITNDGLAYSFGNNNFGQLGLGNNEELFLSPQLITDLYDIELIQCKGAFVICKTYSNECYSWGFNQFGQLGHGNNDDLNKPLKCSNWPEDIFDIKCGDNHALLLTLFGKVYSLGCNKLGETGLKKCDSDSTVTPTLIKDIPLIKRIECGSCHSMCIDVDDNLWAFGSNKYAQLGLGDNESRYKPTLNESLHDIIDISSGGDHTFIKNINNEIYAFGKNKYLQLGIETEDNYQPTPIRLFKDNEDIWGSNIRRSKQKSARK